MTSQCRRRARVVATFGAIFLQGLLAPATANAACVTLRSHPDGALFEQVELADADSTFSLVYVHSVIRTPVAERYHVDGGQIVQTEIEFEQYGPGLPTEADSGGTFAVRDGRFVVTMTRRFPSIVMRVDSDQAPRLVTGADTRDLAQWGNRALVLAASARCHAAS